MAIPRGISGTVRNSKGKEGGNHPIFKRVLLGHDINDIIPPKVSGFKTTHSGVLTPAPLSPEFCTSEAFRGQSVPPPGGLPVALAKLLKSSLCPWEPRAPQCGPHWDYLAACQSQPSGTKLSPAPGGGRMDSIPPFAFLSNHLQLEVI